MGKNNAKLPDLKTLIMAGINPKTGLPMRFGGVDALKSNIRAQLRIVDEQDAVNRYKWYNLPSGLNSQLVERMLYFKGQLAFFYIEEIDTFYLLPYALNSDEGTGLDVYGRYLGCTPVRYTSGDKEAIKAFINGLTRKIIYDDDIDKILEKMDPISEGAVILRDYTNQLGENIIPRAQLQENLLDVMAEVIPYSRTALIAQSGVKGLRVNNPDESANVDNLSQTIKSRALNGDPFAATIGNLEFQDLTSGGSPIKVEEFLLALQGYDNYRLSLYGLKNGGLFQKKSHMLEGEMEMNASSTSLVLYDGLQQRKMFCDLVNNIWGLGIDVEINQEANELATPMMFDDTGDYEETEEQEGGDSNE